MLGGLIAKKQVRKGFTFFSRQDLNAFVSVFADDAVVVYPTTGPIKGKGAIREFYGHFFQTFPKVEAVAHEICLENSFDLMGTNVISTHFEISTTNRKGTTFRQEGMLLIKAKRGRLTSVRYFFLDTENLRRAWRESE